MLTSFNKSQIKVLHLEPTTVCNASCPQCDRENKELFNKSLNCELSLEDVKQLVPVSMIKQLEKMFMCGNFGEPAAAKHCLEIFQYFKQINPKITLGLNTNGGVRSKDWWESLANTFDNILDYVVFSIDGLEDTNHVYRQGVKWSRVIENATAFIQAGGSAHWDMLVFQHNQHQVNQALDLAKEMGFTWFRTKVSKRFNAIPVTFLQPPDQYQLPNVSNPNKIQCHALNEESLFLAANGEYLPCCFVGPRIFNRDAELDQALNTKNFQGVIDTWKTKPLQICKETCGVNDCSSSFTNQWKKEIQLC